jgi:hypothetical protein
VSLLDQKKTFAAIRAMGLTIKHRKGEYRVALANVSKGKEESSAYYTTDLEEALQIARSWSSRVFDYHHKQMYKTTQPQSIH